MLIIMLLFMVMPALFGGFGNTIYLIFNLNNNLIYNKSIGSELSLDKEVEIISNLTEQELYSSNNSEQPLNTYSIHPQLGPYLVG